MNFQTARTIRLRPIGVPGVFILVLTYGDSVGWMFLVFKLRSCSCNVPFCSETGEVGGGKDDG